MVKVGMGPGSAVRHLGTVGRVAAIAATVAVVPVVGMLVFVVADDGGADPDVAVLAGERETSTGPTTTVSTGAAGTAGGTTSTTDAGDGGWPIEVETKPTPTSMSTTTTGTRGSTSTTTGGGSTTTTRPSPGTTTTTTAPLPPTTTTTTTAPLPPTTTTTTTAPLPPTTTTTTVPTVPMPALVGLDHADAYGRAGSAQRQLGYFATTESSDCNGNTDPARFGLVYAQDPAPGTALHQGTPIALRYYATCSQVPQVTGMEIAAAQATLRAAGLQPVSSAQCVPGIPPYVIASQDPGPGGIVRQGTAVAIVVNSGCID